MKKISSKLVNRVLTEEYDFPLEGQEMTRKEIREAIKSLK